MRDVLTGGVGQSAVRPGTHAGCPDVQRHVRRHLLSAGLALAVIAGACGDDGGGSGSGSGSGSGADRAEVGTDVPTYEGTFTVLESSEHGPQLCSGVLLSYPPQCGGPDIVGWDWATVEGETTAGAVRWGQYQVTGTNADGRFTLRCARPIRR